MNNQNLVDRMQAGGHLKNRRLIRAFQTVDRKQFVLDPDDAYEDHALPIHCGMTISQPSMVAVMLELLQPEAGHRVLEVGAGSGYVAALLGMLAKDVYALEIEPSLVMFAKENLALLNQKNVHVVHASGVHGHRKKAPFDRILLSCAVKKIPKRLLQQLADPGILVAPVGGAGYQETTLVRKEEGSLSTETHGACVFVSLK